MKKRLPDQDAVFLVCDDVRHEGSGKVSLLGLFGGGDVQISGPYTEGEVIESLAIYCIFNNGEGEFQVRTKLTDPAGKETLGPLEKARIDRGNKFGLTVRIRPFAVTSLGIYTLTVFIDDSEYTFEFPVRAASSV